MSTLYVVATPIGNLEDITYRAVRVLGEVDALACEDTRTTRKIFERYGIVRPKQMFTYHEHNETRASKGILALLDQGKDVAICTDGGYPGISDPGYRVLSQAAAADHRIEVLPGGGAVPTALLSSGLSTSSYTFKGFPPRKPGPRKRFLLADRDRPHTLVIFESPYRVGKLLAEALEVLDNRQAAVCIELTKKFERVTRGYLSDLSVAFQNQELKGEVTVVIAGNHPKFARPETDSPPDKP